MTEDQRARLVECLDFACGMTVLANEHLANYAHLARTFGVEPPILLGSACLRGQDFLAALRSIAEEVRKNPVEPGRRGT